MKVLWISVIAYSVIDLCLILPFIPKLRYRRADGAATSGMNGVLGRVFAGLEGAEFAGQSASVACEELNGRLVLAAPMFST